MRLTTGRHFLASALEELDPLDWSGGSVTISLASISGPGNLAIWQDGFPDPSIFFDSVGDSVSLAAGSHTHYNWGFSTPGIYELEFAISGTHVADGLQNASAVYTFEIIPEPSAAMLGALGVLAMLSSRRR